MAPAARVKLGEKRIGSGGIRTHASEETGALNQRLRPLGHATTCRLYQTKLIYNRDSLPFNMSLSVHSL